MQVAAEISRMPGISGHADVNGLLNWARAFETKPKHVFVTHGDDTVTEVFAQRLKEELDMTQRRRSAEQNMIFWRTNVSTKLLVSAL